MDNLILYTTNHTKGRIGRPCDGGYVICDLPNPYDCFISGGISNDISFEQDFLTKHATPIPCYAFDGTVDALPVADSRIYFFKKNLGKDETDMVTNLHKTIEPYSNIFMKIDIEGHEFRLFPSFSEDQMKKIKQLVVEIHSPEDIRLHPDYFAGLSDITNPIMLDFFKKINATHTLVHVHPNNACNTYYLDGVHLPMVFECTYIRNDFVTQKIRNTEPIPLSIDRPNYIHNPVVVFDTYPFVCK
jgi:hypothetical protein